MARCVHICFLCLECNFARQKGAVCDRGLLHLQACWNCPICRSKCCCSVTECPATHRHCKAYRYRRRRAELALKRIAAMTDKRSSKKVAPAKRQCSARPLLEIALTAGEHGEVETPPTTAASAAWVEVQAKDKGWMMTGCAEEEEEEASPVDSIVGTPPDGCNQLETARAEEERMQDQLLRGVWSHGAGVEDDEEEAAVQDLPMLMHGHGIEEEAQHEGMAHRQDATGHECDDVMAGVLGHMSEVTDLDEISSHVSELGWPAVQQDVPTLEGLLEEAELRTQKQSEGKEVDEVEWLRRTYETVYNPAARQRALDQLLSTCGSGAKPRYGAGSAAGAPASRPPARPTKCTIMYDFV